MELIKINTEENGSKSISAKELYDFLGLNSSQWKRWYTKNIVKNEFGIENEDWSGFDIVANGNETKNFAPCKFTTHDGVDVYFREDYFSIDGNEIENNEAHMNHAVSGISDRLAFSTREAAQAYLDEQNKLKFKVGTAYRDPKSLRIFMITSIQGNDCAAYGFGNDGSWMKKGFVTSLNECIEATAEEWKVALINETERRGYTLSNCLWESALTGLITSQKGDNNNENGFMYSADAEHLCYGYGCVYSNGKWAEIITEPKPKSITLTEQQLDNILASVKEQLIKELF